MQSEGKSKVVIESLLFLLSHYLIISGYLLQSSIELSFMTIAFELFFFFKSLSDHPFTATVNLI